MAKARIAVPNSPSLRNAHLIGAGNKFPKIKDAQGNIQFRLSVVKQAESKTKIVNMDKRLEALLKSSTSLTKQPSKSKSFTPSR